MSQRGRRGVGIAGLLLGAGLGGFIDGIVFHQILQWHNMLSGWIPPLDEATIKINMLWDGYFHLGVWFLTVLGVIVLWHTSRQLHHRVAARFLYGAMLIGWGVFNVVEGVINHHLLGLHRVHEYSTAGIWWDLAFLTSGLLLVLAGAALARRSGQGPAAPRRVPDSR